MAPGRTLGLSGLQGWVWRRSSLGDVTSSMRDETIVQIPKERQWREAFYCPGHLGALPEKLAVQFGRTLGDLSLEPVFDSEGTRRIAELGDRTASSCRLRPLRIEYGANRQSQRFWTRAGFAYQLNNKTVVPRTRGLSPAANFSQANYGAIFSQIFPWRTSPCMQRRVSAASTPTGFAYKEHVGGASGGSFPSVSANGTVSVPAGIVPGAPAWT